MSFFIFYDNVLPVSNVMYDQVQRNKEARQSNKIILVTVDDRAIKELGGWPLSRSHYAKFLERLADSKNFPQAIGLDILFIDPMEQDKELGKQIARHNVTLPVEIRFDSETQNYNVVLPPNDLSYGTANLSHINVAFDEDGVIRGSNLVESGIPHLAFSMAGHTITPAIEAHPYRRFNLVNPDTGFPTVSLSDVLQPNFPLSIFKDKYVLIGSTAPSLGDHYPSVFAGKQKVGTPGVLFHASLLNDILNDRLIKKASKTTLLIVNGLALIIILLGILTLSPTRELILTVSIVIGIGLVSALLLLEFDYWLNPTSLFIVTLLIKPVWAWRRMRMIVTFIRHRANQLASLKVGDQKKRGFQFSRDSVLQYSNILDQAIQSTRNRLGNLEKIVNKLPEAMLVMTEQNQLVLANQKFQELFYQDEFDDSLSFDQLLARWKYTVQDVEHILSQPPGQTYLVIQEEDGTSQRYMLKRVEYDYDIDTKLFLLMFIGVTDLLRFQAQRDRTLQLLSHDMRTPVASVIALCRKLMATKHSAELIEPTVNQIGGHSKRLLSMMDDFILSIRADDSHYNLVPALFETILDEALHYVKDLAEEKKMTLKIDQPEDPAFVMAEVRLLERVLINLLVNAIRYGKPGQPVIIHVQDINGRDDRARVRCTVINQIADTQPDEEIEKKEKGFGLGLEFVEHVIRKHQGAIHHDINETEAYIARVYIELPVMESD
jgi:CHASE2 domain-containing sensor protein/nitrogen-specific signal transduction histidine kinase